MPGMSVEQQEGQCGRGKVNPPKSQWGGYCYYLLLTEEEIEVQRGEVTCPESHSQEMAAQGAGHKSGMWGRGSMCDKAAGSNGDSQRACVICLGHNHGSCDCAGGVLQGASAPPSPCLPCPLCLRGIG